VGGRLAPLLHHHELATRIPIPRPNSHQVGSRREPPSLRIPSVPVDLVPAGFKMPTGEPGHAAAGQIEYGEVDSSGPVQLEADGRGRIEWVGLGA